MPRPSHPIRRLVPLCAGALLLLGAGVAGVGAARARAAESLPESSSKLPATSRARFT
ncbi:MAG TPA: hypothetical protein VI504_17900 [Candidatus Eisenbacteria bacterium]|jgi:hypothetical protein